MSKFDTKFEIGSSIGTMKTKNSALNAFNKVKRPIYPIIDNPELLNIAQILRGSTVESPPRSVRDLAKVYPNYPIAVRKFENNRGDTCQSEAPHKGRRTRGFTRL